MSDRVLRISDAEDRRLDDYRDVRDPEWLRRREIFLAEGRTVVEQLLRNPRFRPRSLLVTESALRQLEPAIGDGTPIYLVERAILDRVAGIRFHQGCVAAVERPDELSFQALLERAQRRWLVLESVSDPDNVGGLFRNARAFGVDTVALGPGCSHPLYRKATRTSMGATLEVPFAKVPKWPDDLQALRARGFTVVALTPDPDALAIDELEPPRRVALLLGDEGYGLSPAAQAICDVRVRIPMASGADSLNVATAAAIALHRLSAAAEL